MLVSTRRYGAALAALVLGFLLTACGNGGSGSSPTANTARGHFFGGKITAVDAAAKTVTVQNRANETKTFAIGDSVKIQVNGQPGGLADVKPEMFGGVRMGDDNQTVLALRAGANAGAAGGGNMFGGKITAVDANTITITNRQGQSKTFSIPAGTTVTVNRQPATLADVKPDMRGGVRFAPDGVTVQSIMARTPRQGGAGAGMGATGGIPSAPEAGSSGGAAGGGAAGGGGAE